MFKFKQVASVLASAAMLTSTVALAAAATYPAPFIQNGNGDVAVIWGSASNNMDSAAVADIVAGLNAEYGKVATSGSTPSTTVTGETYALFTGGDKLYLNDSLNTVRSGSITKDHLPSVLDEDTFDGNVNSKYQQTIVLGSNPRILFQSQPTSSDDPVVGLALSTNTASYIYNATVTFDDAVAFNDSNSEGEQIKLFGQEFTVSTETDGSSLVLLKSSERITLTSTDPSTSLTVGGNTFTVELVTADATTAEIKVTDSAGRSESRELTEDGSPRNIAGLDVAVTAASENNFQYSATIIAGAEKVTLTNGNAVQVGDNDDEIDGTMVALTGGPSALTKLVVSVAASDSDMDAVFPGNSFTDPVFGSFRLDFTSLSSPVSNNDSSDMREMIEVKNSGDDVMQVKFMDHRNNEKTIPFAFNTTGGMALGDDDGHNITVIEGAVTQQDNWVVVPGDNDEGYLLRVKTVTNSTSGYSNDAVSFEDVFSGDTQDATISGEGTGTVSIGGNDYSFNYYRSPSSLASESSSVRMFYPQSSGSGSAIIYPTLKTSKGALVAFYKPVTARISDSTGWDGAGSALTTLKFPDGEDYTDVTFASSTGGSTATWTVAGGISGTLNTTLGTGSASGTIGALTFNLTAGSSASNQTTVYLVDPASGGNIAQPALIIWEAEDNDNNHQALVVNLEGGASSDDGIGINKVSRTWDHASNTQDLDSQNDVAQAMDRWGSLITVDSSESDQVTATINYPEEQSYALMYMSAADAVVSGGSEGGVLGTIMYRDSEVSSVQSKNLIVVGGSCVNTVAATLLGSSTPLCGSDWMMKTGSDAGTFIIQTFQSPWASNKVATLVAGYNVGDTVNAAKYFKTQTPDTTVGKKYKGTTETQATLMTS